MQPDVSRGTMERNFTSLSLDVSRETLHHLHAYHDLLLKWQSKINLISPKTVADSWERHFCDSAQILPLLLESDKTIFDIGSGGGFPGLILSILSNKVFHFVESDKRKCIFLSEVIRSVANSSKIENCRIEQFKPDEKANLITSRACASLEQLLVYSFPLLKKDGRCIFMKGQSWEQEVAEAEKSWMFHVEHFPSKTETAGAILILTGISPK